MNKEAIEKAISEMPEYVPVRLIERSLGMPKTTLQKVLKGGRELPKKWIKPLEAYFSKEVKVTDQNKQTHQKESPKEPKTNYTINTKVKTEMMQEFERLQQEFLNKNKK